MYTKLIIENGKTKAIFTPENEFETEILAKVYSPAHGKKYEVKIDVTGKYNYGDFKDLAIEVEIIETRK